MKRWLEFFGGVTDEGPLALSSPWWGAYWALLVFIIYVFCAQTSRFLYVDF